MWYPYLLSPPQVRREVLKTVTQLESPGFKGIDRTARFGNSLDIFSAYGDLIAGIAITHPTIFSEREKSQICHWAWELASTQNISRHNVDALLTENPYESITIISMNLVRLLEDGFAIVAPAGSQFHHIIIQARKNGERFNFRIFNAGYGAAIANQSIYTHEARPKSKPGVWGLEEYSVDRDSMIRVFIHAFTRLSIANTKEAYEELTYSMKDLLGRPVRQELTHVQDVPNCSTRTAREFLRFNLEPELYKKIYLAVSGQNPRVDLIKARENAPSHFVQHELNGVIAATLGDTWPEVENVPHLLRSIGTHGESYLFELDPRIPSRILELFESKRNPEHGSQVLLRSVDINNCLSSIRELWRSLESNVIQDVRRGAVAKLLQREDVAIRSPSGNSMWDYLAGTDLPHSYPGRSRGFSP